MKYIGLIIIVFCLSCKQSSFSINDSEFETLIEKAEREKNNSNLIKVLKYVESKYESDIDSKDKIEYLKAGYDFAVKHKMDAEISTILSQLVSEDYNSTETPNRLSVLAKEIRKRGKVFPADIIEMSIVKNYPKSNEANALKSDVKLTFDALPGLFKGLQEAAVDSNNESGLNTQKAMQYIDAGEMFVLCNPNDSRSAATLFNVAEMSRSTRSISKALNLYDKLIAKYPNYERIPSALFIKGFILENEIKDIEKAKATYALFLKKYPNDPLVKDVQFLLENAGKSSEELMKALK